MIKEKQQPDRPPELRPCDEPECAGSSDLSAYARIKATDRLPSPTGVVLEIIRLVDDEETTAGILAPVVESDPALASRLLRLANAPVSGCSRRVSSVQQAVALLGLRTTKVVSLGFCLVSANRSGQCAAFNYEDFWSESIARAATVRHLCARLKALAPDEGFTLGLFSLVGRLAMAAVFPEAYAALLEEFEKGGVGTLTQAEVCAFRIDRYDLSAAMVRDWGLPEAFSAAIRSQDEPDEAPDVESKTLANILSVARTFGKLMVHRDAEKGQVADARRRARTLEIPYDDMDVVFEAVASEWQDAGRILDVPTRHVPPLATLQALADQKRRAAEAARSETQASLGAAHLPDDIPPAEVDEWRACATELPLLTRRVNELAARKTEIAKRQADELTELKRKHESEFGSVTGEYNMALEGLLAARQASARLAERNAQPG
ncbi:MAG: HDOD domain-containing protein [Phycisphaerae bacterium]|jgi:HD-like signal output (HDOD) protein